MGTDQFKYFILIPKNDKNPSPPPFHSKKAQEPSVFDILRPNDYEKLRNSHTLVNSSCTFFMMFFSGTPADLIIGQ